MQKRPKRLAGTLVLCAGTFPLGFRSLVFASSGVAVTTPPTVPAAPVAPPPIYPDSYTPNSYSVGGYQTISYQENTAGYDISASNVTTSSFYSGLINGNVSTAPLEIIGQTVTVESSSNYLWYNKNYSGYNGQGFGYYAGAVGIIDSNATPATGLFAWGDNGINWLKIAAGGTLNTAVPGSTLVGSNELGLNTILGDGGIFYPGPSSGYGIVNVDGGTWNVSTSPLMVGWGSQGFITVQKSGAINLNNTDLQIGQDSSGLPSSVSYAGPFNPNATRSLTHLAAGIGTMVVKSGGTISLTGSGAYIVVGDSYSVSGSSGSLYITGSGSMVSDSGHITVGYAGEGGMGLLAVENGGVLKTSTSTGTYGSVIGNGTSVGSGSGYAIVTGAGSLWSSGSYIEMGPGGAAALVISNGGQVASNGAYVSSAYDYNAGGLSAASNVLIDGVGSSWAISGKADIGENGIGTVTVQNHGSLSVSGQIILGDYAAGNGTLLVQNDGVLTSGDATLGNQAGATGSATITGGGSTSWTVDGDLTVGNSGSGTLTVSSNGLLTTTGGVTFGSATGSTGTGSVLNSGSQFLIDGEFKVGDSGNGSLSVTNGGMITLAGTLAIGDSTGSTGKVTLDGTGSEFMGNGATATIGGSGAGTMTVQDGADALLGGASVSLGEKSGSSGTLTVQNNGTMMAVGSLTVGAYGTGVFNLLDSASFSTTTTVSLAEQANSTGTATIDNAAMTDASNLTVGSYGAGTLNIQNGGSLTVQGNDVTLGEQQGGSGTLIISGSNSALTFSGDVTVGKSGQGTFAVQVGGHFAGTAMTLASGTGLGGASTGGSGTLNITGAGSSVTLSQDLTVGKYGGGSLAVTSGGLLSVQGDATLGSQPGTTGSATIDTGSSWNVAGALTIGSQGDGNATIQNGSSLLASGDSVTIGKSGGSGLLTVTGSKSVVDYAGDLIIGKASDGTMNIQSGAVTKPTGKGTGDVYLAENSGISGALNVDGGGSSLAASDMVVGGTSSKAGGAGLVDITNGGQVNVATTLTMWKNGSIDTIGGSLTIGRGNAAATGSLQIDSGGALGAGGVITGNVSNDGGTVSIGNGKAGTLSIAGNFSQNAGILKIAVSGMGSGQFSQLNATGTVAITGGTVEFDFINGYAPQKGDTFQFIDPPSSVTTNNVSYTYTGLAPGFLFSVIPDTTGLSFTALGDGVATTPEPASLAIFAVGGIGLLGLRLKKRYRV